MKRISITTILMVLSTLILKAPNLSQEYINDRFDRVAKAALEEKILNERVQLLLKTIRIIETRENYYLEGKSGEFGAYQFTPTTWEAYCLIFFSTSLDIKIPANQDKVADAKMRMLIDAGYTDEEIASFWNSGKRHYNGNVGVNSHGVKYNVPVYVKQFINVKNNLI